MVEAPDVTRPHRFLVQSSPSLSREARPHRRGFTTLSWFEFDIARRLSRPFLRLDIAHGGEFALRLRRIDQHNDEGVALVPRAATALPGTKR
jgi:hypothetical protein